MIYFIPIKENSQRVHMKNFRNFSGELLYKHTLLKFSKETVYVDTDSKIIYDQIKSDNRLSNINVYYRDESLIGDKVSVCDLIKNFIKRFKIKDYVCQIHVTSPLLSIETTKKAFEDMKSLQKRSCFSANKIQSRLWRSENYGLCPINHNPTRLEETQSLPPVFEENSLFYIFHSEDFIENSLRVKADSLVYNCNHYESIDIDTEEDFSNAKLNEKNDDILVLIANGPSVSNLCMDRIFNDFKNICIFNAAIFHYEKFPKIPKYCFLNDGRLGSADGILEIQDKATNDGLEIIKTTNFDKSGIDYREIRSQEVSIQCDILSSSIVFFSSEKKYKKIIVFGLDFDYKINKNPGSEVFDETSHYKILDTPIYSNISWTYPNLKNKEKVMSFAKEYSEKKGVSIINANPNSKSDIFDKKEIYYKIYSK